MSSLTRFNNENLNDCGKPVFALIGDNGGESNSFTHYERPQVDPLLPQEIKKVDKIYIEGCIIRNPREITRQISQNCRLQKVSSTVTYQLQGSNVYTPEKVDEIERIFHSKTLTLNGIDIQFEGGQVFEALGEDFPNQFKLNVTISECMKWEIFGCGDEQGQKEIQEVGPVNASVMTFAIPARQVNEIYFNDNGLKVADTYSGLLNYYSSQDDVVDVVNIDLAEVQTDVSFAKIFKVAYLSQAPDAFYYDKFSPSNKVYGLRLSAPNAYNELSRGMNAGTCNNISIDHFEIIPVECSDISVVRVDITMAACEIVPILGWNIYKYSNSVQEINGDVLLNINMFNPQYKYVSPTTGTVSYVHPGDNETLCSVIMDGEIPVNGYVYSLFLNGTTNLLNDHIVTFVGNEIAIYPCVDLNNADTLLLTYKTGGEEEYSGPIGQISGMCAPFVDRELTSADDSQIPAGSLLKVDTDGIVSWNGKLTTYTDQYGLIELKNIKIN